MENSALPYCPHLGLKSDPTTSFSYPSKGHVCFHAKGHPTPELEYQQTTCLTAQHLICPVYKSPPGVILPKNIRQPREHRKFQPKILLWSLLLTIFIAAIFLTLKFRQQIFSQIERVLVPAWQQTQQALPATLPPSPSTELIPTATPSTTSTTTPTSTNTPEPTPSPTNTLEPVTLALETPFGKDLNLILHQVREGESLGQYASRYNTTEAAIRAVNYNMPSVLFIDRILVIPIDVTDTRNLPAFEVIQIEEGGFTAEVFANQLEVDIEAFSLYNQISPQQILRPGDWILAPRESP